MQVARVSFLVWQEKNGGGSLLSDWIDFLSRSINRRSLYHCTVCYNICYGSLVDVFGKIVLMPTSALILQTYSASLKEFW